MKDWLRFGSKIGDHTITGVGRHGTDIQRYKAIHRRTRVPVIITCTMYDKERGPFNFEARAEYRASLNICVPLLDWGKTEQGLFYLVEPDLNIQPLNSLPDSSSPQMICVVAHALACQLRAFARAYFLHGALEPRETVGIVKGQVTIYGVGFRQILERDRGIGIHASDHTAPEIMDGRTWDHKADVYSVCSIVASMWKVCNKSLRDLGFVGDLLELGLRPDPAERLMWGDFVRVFGDLLHQIIEHTWPPGEKTDRVKKFLEKEADSRPDSDETPIDNHTEPLDAKVLGDWEIRLQFAEASDGIESYLAQRIRGSEVALLRRSRSSTVHATALHATALKEWMAKRDTITQPNIPSLVDAGVSCDGWMFVAEDFPAENVLPSLFEFGSLENQREKVLKTVRSAAQALQTAAKRGVFHGDLVPNRDLIVDRKNGRLMVMGIGALQAFGLGEHVTSNPHAAPERRAGEPFDHRADMYALAAILREALSQAGTEELEGCFVQFFEIALAPKPADRFKTWGKFLASLDRCLKLSAAQSAKSKGGTRPAAPTTAPAHTPTSWTPSSSDPTPPPAPQGAKAGEREAARVLELVVNPANENTQHGPKGTEGETIDRETLPSPVFAPAWRPSRALAWIASSVGGVASVAASLALLWSARVPPLAPFELVQSPATYETSSVLWAMSAVEGIRSIEPSQSAIVSHPRGSHARLEPARSRGCSLVHCTLEGDQE